MPDEKERLLLHIFYCSPWESLMQFFLGIRRDNTLRWEIPNDPRGWRKALREAAGFCERRDFAWRERHVRRGTRPGRIWKRT